MAVEFAFDFITKGADRSEVNAMLEGFQFALDAFNVASAQARTRFIQHVAEVARVPGLLKASSEDCARKQRLAV